MINTLYLKYEIIELINYTINKNLILINNRKIWVLVIFILLEQKSRFIFIHYLSSYHIFNLHNSYFN
jgi:hypothetical protein